MAMPESGRHSDPLGYKSPKKGDIVWLERWGGVIGEVLTYEEEILTLTWPFDSTHVFWSQAVQPFAPVKPYDIRILTPREILEKVALLFERQRQARAKKVALQVEQLIKTTALTPFYG